MNKEIEKLLRKKCSEESFAKLKNIPGEKVVNFIAKYVKHCNPDSVFVRGDSPEDADYIRTKAIENGEEKELKTDGHTVHFDGKNDQARDKENTKYLVTPRTEIGSNINSTQREEGLKEVHQYLKDSMEGKEMYVGFFCLGPRNSEFSLPALQITDSSYVMHSEGILYRTGYDQFLKTGEGEDFFKFVHTAGILENGVSKEIDKRRVYIDLGENTVYTTNTQYAGNTVGLKKLAMRLAINKAVSEDWLTEHMFVMGVHGPKERITYFTGAYPSACGKTSTAMINGETIVGDDIAYLRPIAGKLRAVNVEKGIFGIIRDVNKEGQPVIWDAINSEGEVIFSNVLIKDGKPYWLGDQREKPESGINYSGEWHKDKKDENGRPVTPSHKNARFTISISELDNQDERADDPDGVPVGGVIYGGRDSDTCVPVEEAYNWEHGILTKGATLESETTAATLGEEGVRKFNLMSNLDFMSVPINEYLEQNCNVPQNIDSVPSIFSANYFLRNDKGEFLNAIEDKKVWLKWMELRVNDEVEAIKTPTGYIPVYADLKELFREVLNKSYSKKDYEEQFTVRVPELLDKIERIVKIYEDIKDTPQKLFDALNKQKTRLREAEEKYGSYISPFELKS
ncbi:MAG: phosphoenolpyruvate carboxykinase (GTP) [Elusimicrobiota bacterium]